MLRHGLVVCTLAALVSGCGGDDPPKQVQPPAAPPAPAPAPIKTATPVEPTPPPKPVSERENLQAQMSALRAQADQLAKVGRMTLERGAAHPRTVALYDQCVRHLALGNLQGADASFRADDELMKQGRATFEALRVLYAETIPGLQRQLDAIDQRDHDRRMQEDPEYRAKIEADRQKQEEAKRAAAERARQEEAEAERKFRETVAAMERVAAGVPMPEGHPLRPLIAWHDETMRLIEAEKKAPEHKRRDWSATLAFNEERTKQSQTITSSGVTTWALPAEPWRLEYSHQELRYTEQQRLGLTWAPLQLSRPSGWDARLLDQILRNKEEAEGLQGTPAIEGSRAGILLVQHDPSTELVNGAHVYQAIQTSPRRLYSPLTLSLRFSKVDNDRVAMIKPSLQTGFIVLTVKADYSFAPESVLGAYATIVANDATVVACDHVDHKGNVTTLVGKP